MSPVAYEKNKSTPLHDQNITKKQTLQELNKKKTENFIESTSLTKINRDSTILSTLSQSILPWNQIESIAKQACFKLLKCIRKGYIQVIIMDEVDTSNFQQNKSNIDSKEKHNMDMKSKEIHEFGDFQAPPSQRVKLTVCNNYFWFRLAAFSSMGLGEGYMHGEIDVDDLTQLLVILVQNREYFNEMNLLPAGLNWFINQLIHSKIPNTIINALSNIQAHYDLGNDMFASFLDPSMTYSCPIWKTENETLEQAQYNKIDAMLDKSMLTETDHLLEIGTGWGALAIRAVTRFNCRVTSLTLSKEQKILAEDRIAKAGLSDKITVMLCDYRNLNPEKYQFDKIVTVEMLEAVGPEYLPVFFNQCNKLLKPQGILVLQVITMPDSRYENYLRKTDFIQKYIFPGGHCPSITALTEAVYKGSQGHLIIDQIENIGPHYAKALRLWNEAFLANFDDVVEQTQLHHIYDRVFKRKWEYYFCYCRAGFATRTLGDIQMRLTKINNAQLLEGIPM